MKTIDITTIKSIAALTPAQLSELLDFLVAHERAPGGPYCFDESPEVNVPLNAKVYRLFSDAGKELPLTLHYISSSKELLSPEDLKLVQSTAPETIESIEPSALSPASGAHADALNYLKKELVPELYEAAEPVLKKVAAADASGEITKLLELFLASLPEESLKATLPAKQIKELGYANYYTWAAYTLYDTALDDDFTPLTIPAANCLQRIAGATYARNGIPYSLMHQEFTKVDTANALELSYCRFPVSKNVMSIKRIPEKRLFIKLLSARSAVHYLAPIALYKKITKDPIRLSQITSLFNNYLAARQLSDDIHDWEEDFAAGHISYVVARLLQKAKVSSGNHSVIGLKQQLQTLFWQEEMEYLLTYCLQLATQAKNDFVTELEMAPDAPFITVTLEPIIQACEAALKQHEFSQTFLAVQRDKNAAKAEA